MKKTDCYFYFELYDMGAHIPCCTFKEYPLGKCPCDECTNYFPKKEVSQIVREYLEHKAIPSAEPKTGHWIYDKTLENWRCSKCNETPKTMGYVGTADFMAKHFKFCNHCGAKMIEPQEGANE